MIDPQRQPRPLTAILALAIFAAAAIFGHAWTRPPSPRALDAPAEVFSAVRAMAHVEAIARKPHRMGSPEHARVRGYLVDALRGLGLSPEIQEALSSHAGREGAQLAIVRNVIARMKGSGEAGKAVLVVAHYDTRSMTPGASDDGYGVAALLEALRALGAAPRARDVIALFTDGEEEGLFGARAFLAEHAYAREIGVALNFEARGNSGVALMFQTSEASGALIDTLARVVPSPAANSLSQAIYRRMPNDTDLTWFLPRVPSMNVANIGGFERYHAPTDTIDNADRATLQHHGDHALSLARAFASGPLPPPKAPDPIFFGVGPWLVQHPSAWAQPAAIGAAILFAIFLAVAAIRGAVRPIAALVGLATSLVVLAIAAASSALLWSLADALHPSYALINAARPLVKDLHLAAFSGLAIALAIGAVAISSPRVRPAEIFAGALAMLVALAIASAIYLPAGAFLFVGPALFAIVMGLALAITRGFDRGPTIAIAIAAPVPAIVILAPFVTQLALAFGPGGAPASAAIVALIALLAAPVWGAVFGDRRAPIAALSIAFAIYLVAGLVPPFDRAYPRPDTLFFAIDADARKAFWASPDRAPDAWTEAVLAHATLRDRLPISFPIHERPLLASEVPFVAEPAPEITWLDDRGGARRLRITPPPGAEVLAVLVEGPIREARIQGERVSPGARGLSFRFYAPPPTGILLDLTTETSSPITVRAVSQRPGFPDSASPQPGIRPPELMAKPGMMPPWDDLLESDMTLVSRASTR